MSNSKRNNVNHHDDLQGEGVINRIREIVEKNRICFFVTHGLDRTSNDVRPMTVLDVDEEGKLWFISDHDSRKDQEVQHDSEVILCFQSPDQKEFLELQGQASISSDPNDIQRLWHPRMDKWFELGKNDPRISVIAVAPSEGHYWDAQKGGLASGVRMLVGTFFLQNPQAESIEGQLRI